MFFPLLSSSPFFSPSTYAWLVQKCSGRTRIEDLYHDAPAPVLAPYPTSSTSSPAFCFSSSLASPPSSALPTFVSPALAPSSSRHHRPAAPPLAPSSLPLPVLLPPSSLFPAPSPPIHSHVPSPHSRLSRGSLLVSNPSGRETEASSKGFNKTPTSQHPHCPSSSSPCPVSSSPAPSGLPPLSLPSDLTLPAAAAVYSSTQGVDSVHLSNASERNHEEGSSRENRGEADKKTIPLTSFPLYHQHARSHSNSSSLDRTKHLSPFRGYPHQLSHSPEGTVPVYAVIHAAAGLTTSPALRREASRCYPGRNWNKLARDDRIESSLRSKDLQSNQREESSDRFQLRPSKQQQQSRQYHIRSAASHRRKGGLIYRPSGMIWNEREPSRRPSRRHQEASPYSKSPHAPRLSGGLASPFSLSRRRPVYHCLSYTDTLYRGSFPDGADEDPRLACCLHGNSREERHVQRREHHKPPGQYSREREEEEQDEKERRRGGKGGRGGKGEQQMKGETQLGEKRKKGLYPCRELRSCSTTAVLKLQRHQLDHMIMSDDSPLCRRSRRGGPCQILGSRYSHQIPQPKAKLQEAFAEYERARCYPGRWREGEQGEDASRRKKFHTRRRAMAVKRHLDFVECGEDTCVDERGSGRGEQDEGEEEGEGAAEELQDDSFLIEDAVIWQWFHRHIKQWAYTADSQVERKVPTPSKVEHSQGGPSWECRKSSQHSD